MPTSRRNCVEGERRGKPHIFAAAKPTMSTTVKMPMPTQPTSGGTPRFHESAALRRAENIAPRAGRAAIAFGDACDRRVFASTKSSSVSHSRELAGRTAISTHPIYTGQALIFIPRATGAVVSRRPVPRSRADSQIAQIVANDRDRGLGPVRWPRTEKKTATPPGVLRSSGRRRRRPTGRAPRSRTGPRSGHGSGSWRSRCSGEDSDRCTPTPRPA